VDYLLKPVSSKVLLRAVDRALTLGRLAATRRESASLPPSDREPALSNVALAFEQALEWLFVVYQPIVSSVESRVVGYEALARTRERSLANPLELFLAAEQLHRVHELGRLIRERVVEPVNEMEDGALLFVNLHPLDLVDDELYEANSQFARNAKRIVLEITERARLDATENLLDRIGRLRRLGFRMAIDDIGAGYSGLTSFAHVEPEIVKIDMSLVRDIDQSDTKQRIVRSLVDLCDDLNTKTVAEGVETAAEHACCVEIGCTWLQGYRFAKPGEAFPTVEWAALLSDS
jgi:EAL domain-containing protein (putative c-di-GMP-specific phosphodiesterase class I)